jgi:hypothetical protein
LNFIYFIISLVDIEEKENANVAKGNTITTTVAKNENEE